MGKFTLSVCIATYKRPELLAKLLDSLAIQKNVEDYSIEIIVVENDIEALSKDVVENFKRKISFDSRVIVKYDIEPIKNIAITRNKAISLSTGNYIYFIDDDEYADEYWMTTHLKVLYKYNADGAFGQVRSYFSENTPEWIRNCYVFHRQANPSGNSPANLNTGNCIIKSAFFQQKNYRFDTKYGITGGSDFQLFSKMIKEGVNFVSCYEAITYEFVPNDRANIKWLIKRVFRTGNNYTRTLINKNNKQSFLLSVTEFAKGIIQGITALLFSLFFLWNQEKSLNWFLKAISNFSKPFAVFGFYPQEYKKKGVK